MFSFSLNYLMTSLLHSLHLMFIKGDQLGLMVVEYLVPFGFVFVENNSVLVAL